MAKSKQSFLKRSIKVSGIQVIVFVLAFAGVGAYAIIKSFALHRGPTGVCSYNSQVVTASGLPTGEVINFFVKDNTTGNQTGWILGFTDDGNWSVNVPAPKGSTTYDFTSKTWSKSGSKYNVFAECSTG